MTLDEAIEHATQVADSYKDTVPDCDCARDHRQLADWLKKVRVYEKAKKRSVSMIRKLKAENEKLRELAAEAIRLMQADGPDCGLCEHYDECWTGEAMNYSPSGCVICTEARELGIEAD